MVQNLIASHSTRTNGLQSWPTGQKSAATKLLAPDMQPLLSFHQKARSAGLPFSAPPTRKRQKSPSQAQFPLVLTPSLPLDPYPPHLPVTHAPFSSGEPRKQISFKNLAPAPHEAATVREVIDLAAPVFPRANTTCGNEEQGPHEAHWLALGTAKARQILELSPVWPLGAAVHRTMVWYRDQVAGAPARELCLAEVAAFTEASR